MKDVLYTNGDRGLFADYAGSMFVGMHGEIDGKYEIRASFNCDNNPFDNHGTTGPERGQYEGVD